MLRPYNRGAFIRQIGAVAHCFPKISECAGFAAVAEAVTFSVASRGSVTGGKQSSLLQA